MKESVVKFDTYCQGFNYGSHQEMGSQNIRNKIDSAQRNANTKTENGYFEFVKKLKGEYFRFFAYPLIISYMYTRYLDHI